MRTNNMITFAQYFLIEAAKKMKNKKRRSKKRKRSSPTFKYLGGYGYSFGHNHHDHSHHDHGSGDVGGGDTGGE